MSLHIHPLTSWHRAVFLLNSRTGLFVATAMSSGSKSLHPQRHPLFRSYGANLPSSLTLVSLAHLRLLASPTCVGFGTDTLFSTFRSFSRQCSHSEFARLASGYLTPLRLNVPRICLRHALRDSTNIFSSWLTWLSASLHHSNKVVQEY